MGKKNNKNKKNAERKKKKMNGSSPSTSPIEGEAKDSQPSPPPEKVAAVSSERNPGQEPETKLGDKREEGNGRIKVQMMFSKQLEPSDANPELNRAAILVHSYEMKKALSLTQRLKNIPYIRILAIYSQKREYELRFSRQEGGTFILDHEWRKLVTENGLKEGYTVMGYGNEKFVGNQFVVYIRIAKNPESCFLLEKKMERSDLKQLGIGWCSQKLKRDLEIIQEPYVRVLTEAPNMKVYNLSFSLRGDSYILGNEWDNFVAETGLKEGDYVAALGARAGKGRFTSKLFFSKNEETNPIPVPMLFFEKDLESADTNVLLSRLAIVSCKEVVKRTVAEVEKLEQGGGYVRVLGVDTYGRKYELRLSRYIPKGTYVLHHRWGDFVTDHGLMRGDTVTGWGQLSGDGGIIMRIDVDKALQNVKSERH